MQITLTIPDDQIVRIRNAFCNTYGYEENIIDTDSVDVIKYIPNPESKLQFCRRKIIEHIKTVVIDYEKAEARKTIFVTEPDVS